ncbi:UNVERIFIED_CONTAM: hypothetical protein RMT77_013384 [Armadillidium vulgare]
MFPKFYSWLCASLLLSCMVTITWTSPSPDPETQLVSLYPIVPKYYSSNENLDGRLFGLIGSSAAFKATTSSRLQALENQVVLLQATNRLLQSNINDLKTRLASVESQIMMLMTTTPAPSPSPPPMMGP